MADLLIIEDLKAEIAARRCVAIIGSGVSIYSTGGSSCASWAGLLNNGVERWVSGVSQDLRNPANWARRKREDIESALDGRELALVAEAVADKLGAPDGGEYSRWLRESIGGLEPQRLEILHALADLDVVFVTTNYDDLLERTTGLPTVTWMDGARVERVLRGDEKAVVHLHGHCRQPESVILGIRSYEKILGKELAQAMLRAMTLSRCIMFVGCGDGLHDPNLGALMEWTGRLLATSEYRRFRLARTHEVPELQKQHPREQRLFVLGYGERFEDLAPFLRSLKSADF